MNLIKTFKTLIKNIKSPETKNIMTKSLEELSGIYTEYNNTDILLSKKGKDTNLYQAMLLDDTISTSIDLKKKLIFSIDYDIKAASDEDIDLERADFVRDVLNNTRFPFTNILDNFLNSMYLGYTVGETIWKIRDGKWVWDNINIRNSEFFKFGYDEFYNLNKLIIGYNYGKNIELTDINEINKKFMIFCYPYPIDGDWYGRSDLQSVFQQYNQKINIIKWRGIYLQGYGSPIPVVKYDYKTVSSTEKNNFEDMLDNWQDNMYLLIPSIRNETGDLKGKFEVDFREVGKGSGKTPYDETIINLNNDIRRRLLIPDKMGFSDNGGGSYSLGETQFDLLKMIIVDMHRKIENFINPYIQILVDYNFPNVEKYPILKYQDISENIETQLLKLLFDYDVIDNKEKWIRSKLNIPELSEKEKMEIEKENENKKEKPINDETKIPTGLNDLQANKNQEIFTFKTTNKQYPVNLKKIENTYNTLEEEFISDYKRLYNEQSLYLQKQVKNKKIIQNKNLGDIQSLRIKKGDIKNLFQIYYYKLYFEGKTQAIDEIKNRIDINVKGEFKIETELDWIDRKWIDDYLKDYGALGKLTKEDVTYLKRLRDQAIYNTGTIESDMIGNVYKAIKQGIDASVSTEIISSNIQQFLADDLKKYSTTIAKTTASDSYNNARFNLFKSEDVNQAIQAYMYDAVIDNNTTEFCSSHNKQIIQDNDPQLAIINPPNHFNALVKGEMIKTNYGDKPIENINIGDMVLTHKNRYCEVYDVMSKFEDKYYYKLELNNGNIINITEEHPILTSQGWKRVDELTLKDNIICIEDIQDV